jgi:hypothetical protein
VKRRAALIVAAGVLGACSTLVGADFEDRPVREPKPHSSAGAQSTGGAAGLGSGGAAGSSAGVAGAGRAGAGGRAGDGGEGGAPLGGAGGRGGAAGRGGSSGAGGATGGTAGNPGGDGGMGGEPADGVVVLNEIKGQGDGDDYIELFNRGPGDADLGGYGIADANNTFLIPAATILGPGEYLLLLLGRSDLVGEFTCFTPNPCFHASWGVAQDGEMVFLRNATSTVIDATEYPDQAGPNGLANGQSWGRLPNGTGNFGATRLTPEVPNQAP